MNPQPIYQLGSGSVDALRRHFMQLGPADRRLRFGVAPSDAMIDRYVGGIDFGRDSLFGVFDDALELSAVAHLACFDGAAELGLSVLESHRHCGAGTALFARAAIRARNLQISELFMHCLAENAAMMHIARKAGMRIVLESHDADAYVELPPGTALTLGQELMDQQVALVDWTMKAQVLHANSATRELLGRFTGTLNAFLNSR